MYKAISKHVYQRYSDRGLKVNQIHRDLSLRNLRSLVTKPDGTKVLLTKNRLKFIIKDNVVITVMKIRSREAKKILIQYNENKERGKIYAN